VFGFLIITVIKIISFQNLRKKYYVPGELKTREEVEGIKTPHSFVQFIGKIYNLMSILLTANCVVSTTASKSFPKSYNCPDRG